MLILIIITVISFTCYKSGYNKGYTKGVDDGIKTTLDTIKKICNNQIENDTSISKLYIINPDTNIYILSKKHIKIKK